MNDNQEGLSKKAQYDAEVARVKTLSGDEFIKYITPLHRSSVYIVIRDIMTIAQNKEIMHDSALKKEFGVLKQEAKQSWDHDRTTATNNDVNKACTNMYNVVLNLMKSNIQDNEAMFIRIMTSIDEIRAKIGLEPTVWDPQPAEDQ